MLLSHKVRQVCLYVYVYVLYVYMYILCVHTKTQYNVNAVTVLHNSAIYLPPLFITSCPHSYPHLLEKVSCLFSAKLAVQLRYK